MNRITAAATGMIDNARGSLTGVVSSNASSPYLPAAQTTELVSCIAAALHTRNCYREESQLKQMRSPQYGIR